MSPLTIIKYVVERLSGTSYEPAVNFLLFCLLVAAVLGAIKLVLRKDTITAIRDIGAQAKSLANKHTTYAPEVERFRVRTEPYVSLVSNLFFGFSGVISGLGVGIALAFFGKSAPLEVLALGIVWGIASFIYMRFAFVAASWAYHSIKNRDSDGYPLIPPLK